MTTEQFIAHYQYYITELEKMIHPDLISIAENLRAIDIKNHFICQNLDSMTEYEAQGFVWTLFMREIKVTSIQQMPDNRL